MKVDSVTCVYSSVVELLCASIESLDVLPLDMHTQVLWHE